MTSAAPPAGVDRHIPGLGRIAVAVSLAGLLAAGCATEPSAPATAAQAAASPGASMPGGTPAGVRATSTPAAAPELTTAGTALALQADFVRIIQSVSPSVVVIETSDSLGSGIIYDGSGNIVTNAHVTEGSKTFTVTLADGRQFEGTLVGRSTNDDVAVVHIDGAQASPATFADSSKLGVGDFVFAVGNPLGLQSSVTEGIVSAVGRTVSESRSVSLPNLIQTSAAINPGNSGGALVNLSGQVVGIPTLAATDPQGEGAAPGIGFAIASNTVIRVADQLIKDGTIDDSDDGFFGMSAVHPIGAQGMLVHRVQPGGPAARAGIKAGDLISSIDGHPTDSPAALADVLDAVRAGQAVTVVLTRPDGSQASVDVVPGKAGG